MALRETDELAREIYIRRVERKDHTFEFQGAAEAATAAAIDCYRLADVFFAVKKRHERGEYFGEPYSAKPPAQLPRRRR